MISPLANFDNASYGRSRKEDALRLELLRAQIDIGVAALDRGDAEEIDETEIAKYLAKLGGARKPRSKRAR